jgi:predicted DNA-binding antitoxin AbrB/MazE fold protein
MSTTVEAVYEQGVLRLKEPIALPDGTTVEVIIISPDARQGKATPADILTAIASLPLEGNSAEFSGRDHDQIIYGKEEAP